MTAGSRDPDVRRHRRDAVADRHEGDPEPVQPAHARARRSTGARGEAADDEPEARAAPTRSAEAEVAASKIDLRKHDLGHVDAALPSMTMFHAMSTVRSARERRRSADAVADVAPVPAALDLPACSCAPGIRSEQHGREEEGERVDPVGEIRALSGDRMPPTSGPDHPRQVVGRLEQRVRARQLVVVDQVRQPRVDRRPEEARRDAGERRRGSTIAVALPRTGARRRRRSGRDRTTIIRRLRESRSTSGPTSGRSRWPAGSRRSVAR